MLYPLAMATEKALLSKRAQAGMPVPRGPRYDLEGGIAGEFEVREADAVDQDLIGANGGGRFKPEGSPRSHKIILVDAVAADAQTAYQYSILVQASAARKKYDSTFVHVWRTRLKALRAGIGEILQEQIVERSVSGTVDARRKKRLRTEADGTTGHGSSHGHAWQVHGRAGTAIEIDHVASFAGGHINTEDSGIRHAAQTDEGAVEVGDSDHHACRRAERQANGSARFFRRSFGVVQNLLYVRGG